MAVGALLLGLQVAPGYGQGGDGQRRDQWVEETLAGLTVREKVGQLVMPQLSGDFAAVDAPSFRDAAHLVARGVGGFVTSVGMPLTFAAKLNDLQRRARIPLLIASDLESGPGMRMAGIYTVPRLLPQGGATHFPPAMALGAIGSDSVARAVGGVVAREARAVGMHMTFGPVLDVNSNPDNPIINVRSFGEDPVAVGRLGAAFIRGVHDGGVLTGAKHFPGHGDTDIDTHLDLPTIRGDRARLDRLELRPFTHAVEAGTDAIMTAHITVEALDEAPAPPATMSRRVLTGLLREEMGYDGLIITDAMNMGAVVRHYGITDPLVDAVRAGADIILMPVDVGAALEVLEAAVADGRISPARLDASVRRILRAKAQAGLITGRTVDVERVDETVGVREHQVLARAVAERSLTLARDDATLVPMPSATRRVLVVNYSAIDDPVSGRVFAQTLAQDAAVQVAVTRVDAETGPTIYARLRERADSADVILAAAFVAPLEFTGSIHAEDGFTGFVESVAEDGKAVIAVSFGSPYLLNAFPAVPAYLLAWGEADVSQEAAARALLGQIGIRGTLPVSLPPLFTRGVGLRRAARSVGTAGR